MFQMLRNEIIRDFNQIMGDVMQIFKLYIIIIQQHFSHS